MKKADDSWRQKALVAIQEYPRLKMLHDDLHSMQITPAYSGQGGHGSGEQRTTEDIATLELPEDEQFVYDAVNNTVECWKATARTIGGRFNVRSYFGIVYKHFWDADTTDAAIMVMAQLTREDFDYILDCFVSDVIGRLSS